MLGSPVSHSSILPLSSFYSLGTENRLTGYTARPPAYDRISPFEPRALSPFHRLPFSRPGRTIMTQSKGSLWIIGTCKCMHSRCTAMSPRAPRRGPRKLQEGRTSLLNLVSTTLLISDSSSSIENWCRFFPIHRFDFYLSLTLNVSLLCTSSYLAIHAGVRPSAQHVPSPPHSAISTKASDQPPPETTTTHPPPVLPADPHGIPKEWNVDG